MSGYTHFTTPPGSIPIPIEIISPPPYQRSSPRPKSRFQARSSAVPHYDRVIQNSVFNQLPGERSFHHEPFPEPHQWSMPFSRPSGRFSPPFSNADLHSDFSEPRKVMDDFGGLHEALHGDFADAHQNFPTNRPYPFKQQQFDYRPSFVSPHEDRDSFSPHQQPINTAYDRSHSPASQRDESPVRPATQQPPPRHEHESDFKVTRDAATSSTPKASTTATSSQSNDQQVPTTDAPPPRDLNVVALEKLEQIKQHLAELDDRVNTFAGATRDDRMYKLLDEQALKIMMRCDELTNVSADIKEKRKEMVRNVQSVIDKLESKVPINPTSESNSNAMETAPHPTDVREEDLNV